jgi:hypothetical protein
VALSIQGAVDHGPPATRLDLPGLPNSAQIYFPDPRIKMLRSAQHRDSIVPAHTPGNATTSHLEFTVDGVSKPTVRLLSR